MATPATQHGARVKGPPTPGQRQLPRRVYPFRVFGMAAAALPILLVLHEQAAPAPTLVLLGCTALLWPQLAFVLARRSLDPYRAERRNLLLDSALAGLWSALMHFNLLPSVLLLSVANADKINTGVRGLWWRALLAMLVGVLIGTLATGGKVQWASSMPVLLASLPLLVVHTLAVSLGNYRLVRRVQVQNRQLEELSRRDVLTGLPNRRHWQVAATALLAAQAEHGEPASLLLLDLDHFKTINDANGHAVGDDVLCVLGELLLAESERLRGETCRLGGDEFALALPLAGAAAEAVAVRLLETMAARHWRQAAGLRTTLSAGIAEACSGCDLRDWLEAADAALYTAKRAGRARAHRGGAATAALRGSVTPAD